MTLLSLKFYLDLETTHYHAFIGDFCLHLAHGGGQFVMGSDGLAHKCHALQFQLLSGP